MTVKLDRLDRALLNQLQSGLPLEPRPFEIIARRVGLSEDDAIARVRRLLEAGAINRVAPVLSAKAMGGSRTLAAMRVPPHQVDEVAAVVNRFPAVSHNYQREHAFNLWFVVSSADPAEVGRVLSAVRDETGLPVMELPALEEYFLGVRFDLGSDADVE